MSSAAPGSEHTPLPPVDVRLVAPESRYEVDEGRIVYVPPADEPHGSRHSKVSALLEAHAGADRDVASDMLTRTSELSDVAPDASVFPRARDPRTGGRQLEELAFQVVSTERLSEAGNKAKKLAERGVRRIFALDVARRRAFEWSHDLGTWQMLAPDSAIADPALAVPLPVAALVEAVKADDAMASALLAKGNPVLDAALARAKVDALIAVLAARGLEPNAAEREHVLAVRDSRVIDALLARAVRCASVAELLDALPRRR